MGPIFIKGKKLGTVSIQVLLTQNYSDAIKSALASQITGVLIIHSTVRWGRSKKTPKLRVIGLCVGNSPVTGEFPAQRPVTRKMFPFDDVIIIFQRWSQHDEYGGRPRYG